MEAYIERTKKKVTISFKGSVQALLEKLELNPEIVLVTRNNDLLTENDSIKNTDKIKILSVISGG